MKRLIIWCVPLVLLVAIVFWRLAAVRKQNAQIKQQQSARTHQQQTVQVTVAGPKLITHYLSLLGTVESPFSVRLSPKSAAIITYLQARPGDDVHAGQVLVKLDPSDIQGQILAAQASVNEAKQRLAQAEVQTNYTAVGVTSQIRQQQASVASAEADVNQVEKNYEAQVAAAQAAVTSAEAKLQSAQSDVSNAAAALVSAKASFTDADAKYRRSQNLFNQGFLAAQDLEDAKTAADVARANVGVAQSVLSGKQQTAASARADVATAQNQLKITQRTALAGIQDARAKLSQARAQYDLAVANRAQNPAYQANLAALRSTVVSSVGALAQAKERLQDTILSSPVNGTITQRNADPGTLASPGTPVLGIDFLDWLYVTVTIPTDQGVSIVAGMKADMTFDSLPGKKYTGTITQVNKAADPTSRQFTVQVRLDNPGHQVRPGMFARVSIITQQENAEVAVPHEAVQTGPNGSYVMVVNDQSVAEQRNVQTGASDDVSTAITEGLKAGEKVINLSYTPVKDGQKVRIGQSGQGGGHGGGHGRGGQGGGGQGGAAGGQGGGQGGAATQAANDDGAVLAGGLRRNG